MLYKNDSFLSFPISEHMYSFRPNQNPLVTSVYQYFVAMVFKAITLSYPEFLFSYYKSVFYIDKFNSFSNVNTSYIYSSKYLGVSVSTKIYRLSLSKVKGVPAVYAPVWTFFLIWSQLVYLFIIHVEQTCNNYVKYMDAINKFPFISFHI